MTDALEPFSFTRCADGRDRFDTFLSMDSGFAVKSDYAISIAWIFTHFAAMLVQRGRLILVLKCLGLRFTYDDRIVYQLITSGEEFNIVENQKWPRINACIA